MVPLVSPRWCGAGDREGTAPLASEPVQGTGGLAGCGRGQGSVEGPGHSVRKLISGGGLTLTGCEERRGGEGLGWACCCMVS